MLNGGTGDDTLKGGRSGETSLFDISWGHDTIIDKAKAATPSTPFREINKLEFHFERDAPVSNLAINLESDSGPVPEMTDGVNTVNWDGDIIAMVDNNNPGSDTITGDGQANHIYNQDGSGSDTINGGGGNDYIVVQEGVGGDTVECGPGTDTVLFDDGDVNKPQLREAKPLGGSRTGSYHRGSELLRAQALLLCQKTWDLAHLGDAQPAPGELRYSYYLGGCG